MVIASGAEANFPFLAATLGAQIDGSSRHRRGHGNGLDPAIGFGGGYAMATGEARDWVNSNLVLNVGSNFRESSLPQVRLFFEAKEAGAKMVTVDPHFSTTAGEVRRVGAHNARHRRGASSWGWPASSLESGWQDEAFMATHTVAAVSSWTPHRQARARPRRGPGRRRARDGRAEPLLRVGRRRERPARPTPAWRSRRSRARSRRAARTCNTVFTLFKESQKPHTPNGPKV